MEEDKLEELLFELGKVIQELALIAETDPESSETEKRADEIKDQIMQILIKLESAKCYFIVQLEMTDEVKERVKERDLADFFWGFGRYHATITIRMRRHGLRSDEVVCDPLKLTLNPKEFLIRLSDKTLWAEKIRDDLDAKTNTNLERFVLGFLANQALKHMDGLADEDELSCGCQAEFHRKVFSELKQKVDSLQA